MIYSIDELKDIIGPIAKQYGIQNVFLFGSCSRNEATEESDIDLKIDKGNLKSLFQLTGFRLELEEKLNKSVDLVTSDSSDKEFLKVISREEVLIYAQS